ncbi:hypothetical protein [Actinocorallia longicatena]|uniref:Methyltransferase family protein n=1 Tax=Actinocorallia longicatena TaxID=111803 RepID=A0ABP6QDK1_9ACTN
MSTERFFSAHWTALAHDLPAELAEHLDRERAELRALLAAHGHGAVIEAGCADGSLMWPVARDLGLPYFGVDLAAEAVARLRPDLPPGSLAVAGDVVDLPRLLAAEGWRPGGRVLAVLPFNLVGILPDPGRALLAVADAGADVLVLAYRQSAAVRAVRARYFERCGLAGAFTEDERGQHFRAPGYTSSALRPEIVKKMIAEAGFQVTEEGRYGLYGLSLEGLPAGT